MRRKRIEKGWIEIKNEIKQIRIQEIEDFEFFIRSNVLVRCTDICPIDEDEREFRILTLLYKTDEGYIVAGSTRGEHQAITPKIYWYYSKNKK